MKNKKYGAELGWLLPFKRRLIFGLSGLLTSSIVVTLLFLTVTLRSCLLEDSTIKTKELGAVIEASLIDHMMLRDLGGIQKTLDGLRGGGSSVEKAFLIDREGRIAYSTDHREVGATLDRTKEPSCAGCHSRAGAPREISAFVTVSGRDLQRVVRIIYNRPECYGCHPASRKINGKLIIDRSLASTHTLVTSVVLMVIAFGGICLALMVPFVSRFISRGMNTYIDEIHRQDAERSLLYMMMERLSKTIDIHELEVIIIEIVRETILPEEVDMVLTRDGRETRAIAWTSEGQRIDRKPIEQDAELGALVDRWLAGEYDGGEPVMEGRRIAFAAGKGNRRFALVVARRREEEFGPEQLRLVRALVSHISVALENAYLYYIAITDELTHLFTQRHFRSSIDREFREFLHYGKKLTLLMVDLDNFKAVNDTYGHPAGDHVLRRVAGCVMDSIRDNDLAFRYGGEEFAVLLPATGGRGGSHVAERIRQSVAQVVVREGGAEIRVTVSIGLATCPDQAGSVRDLILAADSALYEAKRAGKNRVVVHGN